MLAGNGRRSRRGLMIKNLVKARVRGSCRVIFLFSPLDVEEKKKKSKMEKGVIVIGLLRWMSRRCSAVACRCRRLASSSLWVCSGASVISCHLPLYMSPLLGDGAKRAGEHQGGCSAGCRRLLGRQSSCPSELGWLAWCH